MSQGTGTSSQAAKRKSRGLQLPPWAVPIANTCEAIFPFLVGVAFLLLVLILALIFVGRTQFTWLPTVLNVCCICMVVGFLAATIARYDSVFWGWLGILFGVAFLFGGPIALAWLAHVGNIQSGDDLVTKTGGAFPQIGIFLLTISLFNLVVGYAIKFMYYSPERGAKQFKFADQTRRQPSQQRPGAFPKCWQMSRCRPGVRETCPNFLERQTCWKRRSGCFCDRDLANFLVGSVDRKEVQEVIDMQVQTAKSAKASEIRTHLKTSAKRPWRMQKQLCHECPLYLEHQEYKYKYWHWVSFPATVLIAIAAYEPFHEAYKWSVDILFDFMQKLVKMGGLPDNFVPSANGLADSPFQYLLLVVLSVLLASYVVAFTDTVFLKWKL